MFVQGAAATAVTAATAIAGVAERLASDGNSINRDLSGGYEIEENCWNTYRLLLSIDW